MMSLVLFWRDDNVLPLEKTRTPCEFTNDSEKYTIQVHYNMIRFAVKENKEIWLS